MSVPYIFANDTGNIALSDLDVNFANVKASADTAVVVTANAQPNITSLGTLNSLTATGNISTSGYFKGNGSALTGVIASNANATNLIGNTLSSNVLNSSLTSVGTLGNLQVTGPVTAGGAITGLTVSTIVISASGNVTGGNILTAGALITGSNIVTGGQISAVGNITTAGTFIGTFAGNISGNLTVPGSNTQVLFNNNGNAGTSSGFTFNSASNVANITGTIQGGNLLTSGVVSAAGNITGGNLSVSTISGTVTTAIQPNITTVGTLSNLSVFGNVTAVNVTATHYGTGTGLTALNGNNITSGQVGAAYVATLNQNTTGYAATVSSSAQPNITSVGTLATATVSGNTNSGNVLTSGLISASGTVTGAYIVSNGSLLTNLTGANVTGTVANATYALNANNSTFSGTVTTNAQPNITSVGTLTSVSVSGNIQVNNISTTGAISATGNIIAAGLYVGSNTTMLSNVARYTWVSNVAPGNSQGNIGDIWYQTF